MRTEDLRMWAAADVGEFGIRAELPAASADAARALARFDEAGATNRRDDVVAFVRDETPGALPGRDARGVPVPAAELVGMETAVMPPRPRPRPATPLEEAEWVRSQRKGGGGDPGSGPPAPAMEPPPPEQEWTAVHGIGEGTLPEPALPGKRRPAPRPARSVEKPRSPAEERAHLKGADKAQGREGPKPPPSRAR